MSHRLTTTFDWLKTRYLVTNPQCVNRVVNNRIVNMIIVRIYNHAKFLSENRSEYSITIKDPKT